MVAVACGVLGQDDSFYTEKWEDAARRRTDARQNKMRGTGRTNPPPESGPGNEKAPW